MFPRCARENDRNVRELYNIFQKTLYKMEKSCYNNTVNGKRRYLYPLIPFNGKAMLRLIIRRKKIN